MKYVEIDQIDGLILTINNEPVAVVGVMPKLSDDWNTGEHYESYDLRGYALRINGREVSNFGFATANDIWNVLKDVASEYLGALDRLKWKKEKIEKGIKG